jgi:hypothetical protein
MSMIAKKSILGSGLLGVCYMTALFFPGYFTYVVVAMIFLVIIIWKYFFNVAVSLSGVIDKFKFLTLPMIFNVGALYLTTIFFQTPAKVAISVVAVVTNYFLWIALRKVHNLTDRAAIFHRNILIVISFVSVFLGSATVFRLFMLFSTASNRFLYQSLLVFLIFILFYIVSSFLTWENGADDDIRKLKPYNIIISLLGAQLAWISSFWIVNYPVIGVREKANLGGTPLPAIYLTIVFYFLWGIIFHKLDGSLTRRVLTEYIIITLVFITVLLATAKWLPTF